MADATPSPIDMVRRNVEHERWVVQRIDEIREHHAEQLRQWEQALANMETAT